MVMRTHSLMILAMAWLMAGTAMLFAAVQVKRQPGDSSTKSAIAAPARWEYQVMTKEQVIGVGKKDLAAGLNKLGEDGWELVAVEPSQTTDRDRKDTEYYFKRLKTHQRAQE